MSTLGHKALTCLALARDHQNGGDFTALWSAACALYHPRVLEKKFNDLLGGGYIECGVSPRTGWPTPKGLAALVGFERRKL